MSDSTIETPADLTCEQCRELLSSYVDRELTPTERTAVEKHVRTCTVCAQETTCVKGLKNLVENWEGVKGNTQFRDRVMQEFIRESQMTPSKPFTDAADQARQASVRETAGKGGFSKVLLWGIILLLALGAAVLFFVSQWNSRH